MLNRNQKKLCFILFVLLFCCYSFAEEVIKEFNIRERLLQDTSWVQEKTKIYYTSGKDRYLYSINADGTEKTKIIGELLRREFGWSPLGDKLFVVIYDGLVIVSSDGKYKEKIIDNVESDDTDEILLAFIKEPYSTSSNIEWSPDGKFLLFGIIDEDTNKDGKIRVFYDSDGENYYLFNLATQEKIKFFTEQKPPTEYPVDYTKAVLWSKDSKRIYIFNTHFISGDEPIDQVFEYSLKTHELKKIREDKHQPRSESFLRSYMEDLKDSLYFTRRNFTFFSFVGEHDGISFERDNGRAILKKREEDKFVYYNMGDCDNFAGAAWLPNKRYIIFKFGADICIMDSKEMRVGRLVEGKDFGFFERDSDICTWRYYWERF